jgi:hypothetical protein
MNTMTSTRNAVEQLRERNELAVEAPRQPHPATDT